MNKIVIIGDIHHHLNYPKSVIEKESDADKFIFLGDWFDSFRPSISAEAVATYMMELYESDLNTVFLVGNHDIGYYEVAPICRQYIIPHSRQYKCSGYSNSRAKKISKIISEEFIFDCKLVHFENGHLMSHAGILPHLLPVTQYSDEEALQKLLNECNQLWKNFRDFDSAYHSILKPGSARGGIGRPGVTWCDWIHEFKDALPWPQIVGHTAWNGPPRFKGNSVCIDNPCGYYIVLEDNELYIEQI